MSINCFNCDVCGEIISDCGFYQACAAKYHRICESCSVEMKGDELAPEECPCCKEGTQDEKKEREIRADERAKVLAEIQSEHDDLIEMLRVIEEKWGKQDSPDPCDGKMDACHSLVRREVLAELQPLVAKIEYSIRYARYDDDMAAYEKLKKAVGL